MLRIRRHVRDQERRYLGGDVRRQGRRGARQRGAGALRRRQLMPDAHRRRAHQAAGRRHHQAPGRDPGEYPVTGRAAGDSAASMPTYIGMPAFPEAADAALGNAQLRRNLAHATTTIRVKRAAAVAELADWQQLRAAAKAIQDHTLAHLDTYLTKLEQRVTDAGGQVHWARSEEHTAELQSRRDLVCRLLLEKKKR